MNITDIRKLRKLYAEEKYIFTSLSGESRDGQNDSAYIKMKPKGWQLIADEQNDNNFDSIWYKIK